MFFAAGFVCSGCSAESSPEHDGGDDMSGGFVSSSFVELHSVFSSGMVVQRNAVLPVRGVNGTPGQPIRVVCSWMPDEHYDAMVGEDGTWCAEVPVHDAGGPYEIVVQGRNRVTLTDVMAGDVWFCAGQSNMQMMMTEIENADREILSATESDIRLFNIESRVQSEVPVDNIDAVWQSCNPNTVRKFSAAAYFFGKTLYHELDVSIGLINSSWGNTPCEVWTEREIVYSDEELKADADWLANNGSAQPNKAGYVYNAMVYPFTRFPIAGVIWYQGENNQSTAWRYGKLLSAMIEGWRADWNDDFPFIIAQICPRYRQYDYLTYYSNAVLRDQQRRVAENLDDVYVTVNDDIADLDDSHPKNKQDVGRRLAWTALAEYYGIPEYEDSLCPVVDKVTVSGNRVQVSYKNTGGVPLKTSDGNAPSCFEIAGADKVFYPAEETSIEGESVFASSPEVPSPVYVRAGWSYFKIQNLTNANGLPVSVFSTQDFPDAAEEPDSMQKN